MTYAVKDVSVESGEPVEFYKFTGPFGTFRYTTDNKPGVCNGELYIVLEGGVSRTPVDTGTATDSVVTCDITLPATCDLAVLYCYTKSPDELMVEVRRAHRGDDWNTEWEMEWHGFGLDTSTNGDEAVIRTGSALQALLTGNIASIYYQRSCNHKLFDSRCGVDKANWTLNATITKIQSSIITVDDDQAANDALAGGEIVNTRTGESRTIYSNTDNVLRVSAPLVMAEVGDTVELVFGCDHSRLGHCKNRFDNVQRFGGFPFIPTVNPFTDLHLDSKVVTSVKEDYVKYRTSGYTVSGS